MALAGIFSAFAALVTWGIGDFFTQRSAKKFGDWESLFNLSLIATLLLFPFVYKDLPGIINLNALDWAVLALVSVSYFTAQLVTLEAFRRGKLAIVEPLGAAEIPVSALLAFIFLKEIIPAKELLFVFLLVIGLILIGLRSYHFKKHSWLERGLALSLLSAFLYGLINFLVGFSARLSGPLITVWIFNLLLMLIGLIYLLMRRRFGRAISDLRNYTGSLILAGGLESIGWFFFAFAAKYLSITIALALSEGYIIIAVLLGVFWNKEKLLIHQKIGLIAAVTGAIILAALV